MARSTSGTGGVFVPQAGVARDGTATTMIFGSLSLAQYDEFCRSQDVGACYAADMCAYYFAEMKRPARIIGRYDRDGRLVAAYPSLYGQLFPNTLHKRLLGKRFQRVGDIGQPEGLFPVRRDGPRLRLYCLSPVTSGLLANRVGAVTRRALRKLVIAKHTDHTRDSRKLRSFLANGGCAVRAEEIDRREFADVYVRLHCARWNYPPDDFRHVRQQIIALYEHVHGTLLLDRGEPVGAHFCLKHVGGTLFHVESVNIGVKPHSHDDPPYGSLLLLASLRSAEQLAAELGKTLRWNYGYWYGQGDYKSRWGDPEESFVAF